MDFVNIFKMSLQLFTIYFVHFSCCCAYFVNGCHSILQYYNLYSGVKLSVRSLSEWMSLYPTILEPVFWSQVEYKIILFYFGKGCYPSVFKNV